MSLTVYARRASDLSRIGEIDDFDSLTVVKRFNATSRWTLTLPGESVLADGLDSAGGIVIERDGEVLISGPVDLYSETQDADSYSRTVSGPDDSVWLDRRLVHPSAPLYTSSAYDTRTGVAETILHEYVNNNLGPSALAARQVLGLTLGTDTGAGSSVTGKGRFQVLADLLRQLAIAGGDLGFRIVQVDDGLEFQTYEPTDRTASAQFSIDLGNLAGFSYERQAPKANYITGAGAGTGTSRLFVEGDDSPSVAEWGRIEMFRDRRDTAIAAEITQTITEELATNSEVVNLSISPIDTPKLTFMADYDLGDRVTVTTPAGHQIQDVVREVSLTYSAEGEVIEPVVGTPGATNPRIPEIYRQRRYIERRTQDLERAV